MNGYIKCDLPSGWIQSSLMAKHGILAVFSSRHGGISPAPYHSLNLGFSLGDQASNIEENIRRFCQFAHITRPHCVEQVHGTKHLYCSGEGRNHAVKADILLTQQAACPLAVRTADCIPLLLADPRSGIIAAVHAGWRGTAAGIVKKCVQHMQKAGANSDALLASIGPGIGGCCFYAGEDVLLKLDQSIGATYHRSEYPKSADLALINQQQLLQSGLRPEHIEYHAHCTACEVDDYFSYRQEGGLTGRQWAAICR